MSIDEAALPLNKKKNYIQSVWHFFPLILSKSLTRMSIDVTSGALRLYLKYEKSGVSLTHGMVRKNNQPFFFLLLF